MDIQPQQPIVIDKDKSKLRLLLVGAYFMVALGVFIAIAPVVLDRADEKLVIAGCLGGLLAIVFFGFAAVQLSRQINDPAPAVVISAEGVTDRSSPLSVGFIPWSDITGIRNASSVGQLFVTIQVKDPQVYIDKVPAGIKRWMVKMNRRFFQSAIFINANSLKCSHDELRQQLTDAFARYGQDIV